MAYLVKKTVKGKQYWYRQESYRRGGKVKTRSEYIGAVSELGNLVNASVEKMVSLGDPKRERKHQEPKGTGRKSGQRTTEDGQRKGPATDREVITTKEWFTNQCDFSGYISAARLRDECSDSIVKLAWKGISMRSLPTLVLKHGKKLGHRQRGKKITVTLPKKRTTRTAIRHETHKAHGRALLQVIAREEPKAYAELSLQMNKSFRETNRLLCRWVGQTRARNKASKLLILWWWGQVDQIQKSLPGQEAERIGLVDFSRRPDWETEFCSVYASLKQKGQRRFWSDQEKQTKIARLVLDEAEVSYAKSRKLSPSRAREKNRVKRARARLKAQEEMRTKALTVQRLFF